MYLKGKKISLRAVEPEDLEFLYQVENEEIFWEISNTNSPYSKWVLRQYLENAKKDIYEAKQLRLIIEESKQKIAIGTIDLFDFDPKNLRAGIGILIQKEFQGSGFGSEAVELLIGYGFSILNLNQIFVNITEDNLASIKLFSNFGFELIGVKKEWIYQDNKFKNELMFQLIKSKF